MSRIAAAAVAAALIAVSAAPVRADATGFMGANTTPQNRLTRGFAVGAGLLIVAIEFEYANTPDDPAAEAPSLRTFMGNSLLQTPFAIFGFQPYATAGGGVYRERLGSRVHTSFAPNVGGGVKISLVGPLRLRLDYRVFKLGDGALHTPAHRVYAGLNLRF
jgi:hypothetical protein